MSKKQLDLFNVKMMGGVAAPFKGQDKDTKDKSINPSDEKTQNDQLVERLVMKYRKTLTRPIGPMNSCVMASAIAVIAPKSLDNLLAGIKLPKKLHSRYFRVLENLWQFTKGYGSNIPAMDIVSKYLKTPQGSDLDPDVLYLIVKLIQKLP